jgi:hypothetical protein
VSTAAAAAAAAAAAHFNFLHADFAIVVVIESPKMTR